MYIWSDDSEQLSVPGIARTTMAEGFRATRLLQTAKRQLRSRIRQRLALITSGSLIQQSEEVQAKLLTLAEYKRANRISIYLSMPTDEILTRAIVLDALREGKRVFVPYILPTTSINTHESKSVMTMVSIQSKEDYESLRPDAWGIPTPDETTIERREVIGGFHEIDPDEDHNEISSKGLDLVVMPGLAFDKRLKRLGHGKGYYDFFLQKLQQVTSPVGIDMPFLVGLALKEQILPTEQNIPADASDWPLDALIVGDGSIIRR